jgi:hypothetical protein
MSSQRSQDSSSQRSGGAASQQARGPSSQADRESPPSTQQYANWTRSERQDYLDRVSTRRNRELHNQVMQLGESLYDEMQQGESYLRALEEHLPRREFLAAVGRFDELSDSSSASIARGLSERGSTSGSQRSASQRSDQQSIGGSQDGSSRSGGSQQNRPRNGIHRVNGHSQNGFDAAPR